MSISDFGFFAQFSRLFALSKSHQDRPDCPLLHVISCQHFDLLKKCKLDIVYNLQIVISFLLDITETPVTRINCVPRRCLLHLLTVVINLGDGDKEIFLPLWPGGVSPLCLLLPRSGDTADKECPGPATGPGATTTDHPVAKPLHAQIVQGDYIKCDT